MDDVVRSRRLLLKATVLAWALASALGGCQPRPSGAPVGTSTARPAPEKIAGIDGGAAAPGAIPADFRVTFEKANQARFVSTGHAGGRWAVDVYVNAAGKEALRAERGDVPVGARFVKEHFERRPSAPAEPWARGPVMMMEKRAPGFDAPHGDWRYVVVGASGELIKDGPIASCAGCHDDAPHDHLFRVAE